MKTLTVLVGLPAAGKSTYRDKLVETDPSIAVISSDDYIEEMAKAAGSTYSQVFASCVKEANRQCMIKAAEAFKEGKNVVWDQTNLSSRKRKTIVEMAPTGYTKTAIVFNVKDKTEHLARLVNRPGKEIPLSVIENLSKIFEEVDALDEGFHYCITIET